MPISLDAAGLRRWAERAVAVLTERRDDINALNDESEDTTFGVSILRTQTGEMVAIAAGAAGESVALEADDAYLESHHREE